MAIPAVPQSEDTRVYECAILYPYPIAPKEEQQLLKDIEALFTEAGGKLMFKDPWGRRGLAYKIGGYDEANVIIYYYDLDPKELKEIENQLKITKGVLRHMVVKPPKGYSIASYADNYDRWKEKSRVEEERRAAEKEEKLKKQVVDKAKRATKAEKPERKPADVSDKPKADLGSQLDKLVSDKDIEL